MEIIRIMYMDKEPISVGEEGVKLIRESIEEIEEYNTPRVIVEMEDGTVISFNYDHCAIVYK